MSGGARAYERGRVMGNEKHRFKDHAVTWGVHDFVGKFHLKNMTTGVPIPGTAIRCEQERVALIDKRAKALEIALGEIDAWRRRRAASRARLASISARVEVQATVGYRMAQRMYDKAAGDKKQQLSSRKHAPDEDFYDFLRHVESNNVYEVRSLLRDKCKAFRLVSTAEEKYGSTPLHRSVSLGFVAMSRMLLEAGAAPDEVNSMGDAPMHSCWRFWRSDTKKYFTWKKNRYLMTTRQHLEDFARMDRDVGTTIELLKLLTHNGADTDVQRNNGEFALHTAARRGPIQAVWILLLSGAAHDKGDVGMMTPEAAASRAGHRDIAVLLANWPIAKLKYLDSEFVQEWMKFLRDPDARLDTDLTADEVLALVRTEEHEESTTVRARGGHLLIDELITGPITSAQDEARAKITSLPAEDGSSLTSTCESSARPGVEESALAAVGGDGESDRPEDSTKIGHAGSIAAKNKKKTKSRLGKELGELLAQARDESAGIQRDLSVEGGTAYSRLTAKMQLEGRRARWPRPRDNGKDPPTGGRGSAADPLGRPMTTSQRRRIAALEVAEDAEVEGPLLRPATTSVLLTTRSRAAAKAALPHPYYGRRLLTQRLLQQREREASIKPTATIRLDKGFLGDGDRPRSVYLNENRTAFNDVRLLPGHKDPSFSLDDVTGRKKLHVQHPVMLRRKLHERPYCELQGTRRHDDDVYCSIVEDYRPENYSKIVTSEPLVACRKHGPSV